MMAAASSIPASVSISSFKEDIFPKVCRKENVCFQIISIFPSTLIHRRLQLKTGPFFGAMFCFSVVLLVHGRGDTSYVIAVNSQIYVLYQFGECILEKLTKFTWTECRETPCIFRLLLQYSTIARSSQKSEEIVKQSEKVNKKSYSHFRIQNLELVRIL